MSETYGNMKAKIERDLDTEDEDFVQEAELLEYFNDAQRECEAHIHKLGLEDIYFKTSDTPSLVTSTSSYSMPSDIYLNKILKCVYNDGNRVFEVKKLKGRTRYLDKALIENSTVSQPIYQYDITNASAALGTKWVLTPASQETSTNIERHYIRKVAALEDDDSICDVPDVCLNFIYAYVSWRIWGKEGDARATDAKDEMLRQQGLMLETLSEMTPDDNNDVEMDGSIYDEMS